MIYIPRLTGFNARVRAPGGGGGGGGSVTVEIADAHAACAIVYRISNWGGTIADDIDRAATDDLSDSPDPPAVTAGWGSDTNLFLAGSVAADDDGTYVAAPANYTNLTTGVAGAGVNASCSVAMAERQLTAASDNPGAFTLSELEAWQAFSIVVKPDSGYPVVEDRLFQAFPVGSTTHDVDLPETINTGDLLIMLFSAYDSSIPSGPDGWTQLWALADLTTTAGLFVKKW